MHEHRLENWRHRHDFWHSHHHGERRTLWVLGLTWVTMVAEIWVGVITHSMALLADGWHMATHVAAFLITLFAYRYERLHADDQTFAFGPGKVGVLGGFASAVALSVVALMMVVESTLRLLQPEDIQFEQAILVAQLGLVVNLLSALILGVNDHHAHHGHGHHHDHNLRAAYVHVLSDALTSILAIAALLAAKWHGWLWLDPVSGWLGALVILAWAYQLMKDARPILLDESGASELQAKVMSRLQSEADNRISDLHIWPLGTHGYSAVIAIVTRHPKAPTHYKKLLADCAELLHVTIEVNACIGEACRPAIAENLGNGALAK
ncbi:MAG: CDF family Co(II)/Ni(II) efflux transporter DmeF [Methylococcales bacterium]|nr:CDF family Co(II)/Ni(II) efflux transporter DmeF [Methylococcales bacterium]